jgi:hypothetical protein
MDSRPWIRVLAALAALALAVPTAAAESPCDGSGQSDTNDADDDGIRNCWDPDDDNDGVPDQQDPHPQDTDDLSRKADWLYYTAQRFVEDTLRPPVSAA